MKFIGIVGSSHSGARGYAIMKEIINNNKNCTFVSGGAEGVDTVARIVCNNNNVPFIEMKPDGIGWEYYKTRNLRIAEKCDKVYSLAMPLTKQNCFHCEKVGKNSNHEKTAGCYTGKACGNYEVIILDEPSPKVLH